MVVVSPRHVGVIALCWIANVSLLSGSCNAQRNAVHMGSKIKKVFQRKSSSNGKTKTTVNSSLSDTGKFTDPKKVDYRTRNVQTALAGYVLLLLFYVREMTRKMDISNSEREDVSYETNVMQSCEIGFEDIKMVLQSKKKNGTGRVILDGSIRGKATPGRMLAVMGPSGSGKSTFLHALAGKVKEQKTIALSGKRYLNENPVAGESQMPVAFVGQEVNFFPYMTVKETLDFRVELKLGSKLGKSARDDVVSDLLELLGLTKSADTIVGDSKVRGLSGGERKRLSIACELISSPPAIFLDEPTSGLDSYQAAQVVDFLRKLADSGKTVIAVIHQPSTNVFSMFDDLLLLSEGKMMYFGEVSKVRSYLADLGYVANTDVGTAEHVLECISAFGGKDELDKHQATLKILSDNARESTKSLIISTDSADQTPQLVLKKNGKNPAANIFRQLRLLFRRSLTDTFRGKVTIILKVVQQITLASIYGGIYKLGNNQASIMDRYGLISLIAIGAANMAIAGTVRSFPKEKAIVSSELSSGLYRTFPYFVSKAIAEIPLIAVLNGIFSGIIYPMTGLQKGKFLNFLKIITLHGVASEGAGLLIGSISKNSDMALALMPPILVLNIIFDGKNISEENIPKFLRWIPKLGLIRWGFEGLSLNEFEGLTFDTSGPRRGPKIKDGFEALERFELGQRKIEDVFKAQSLIIAGCWALSYFGLSFTRERFQVMQLP